MRIIVLALAVGVLVAAAPLGISTFMLTLLTEMLIMALFAMSLDLMVGYTRLISFGHAASYGLGAYASGLLLLKGVPLPVSVLCGAFFAGIVAIGIGWVCTLAKGPSFTMLTLAFGQLCYAVVLKWQSMTGGSDGLAGIPRAPGPFGLTWFGSAAGFHVFVVVCLTAAFLICHWLTVAPFGLVLRGIRDNEPKVRALGYNTRRYKIAVTVVAFFFGGLAGALYAPFAGFAAPDLFYWLLSGNVLIMVIVGGNGTLVGPIVGAIFFMLLEQNLSQYTESWTLIFGLIFIVVVLFAPGGLVGEITGRSRGLWLPRIPGRVIANEERL